MLRRRGKQLPVCLPRWSVTVHVGSCRPAATGNLVDGKRVYPGALDPAVGVPTNAPADGQSATSFFFASLVPDAHPVRTLMTSHLPPPGLLLMHMLFEHLASRYSALTMSPNP